MEVRTGIALKHHTTMALGGEARFMAQVQSPAEVAMLYKNAQAQSLPVFVLGGGSNVIARDEGYNGIVLVNHIKGFEVLAEDDNVVRLKIGAGEIWDEVVLRTVEMGLSGIEAMSGIPGTAGAAPVQNVGAYGQEIADTLVSVEAYDSQQHHVVTLSAAECEFSYRHSIFRSQAATGRYCILSVILQLYREPMQPPFYTALQRYLDDHQITTFTPAVIRQAVLAIRADKLPDPAKRPNAGSFFKNAIIERWQLNELSADYPDMPYYDMPNNHYKIPTGWLIEQAGLKGQVLHGMRVHDKNALVLINESAASYSDLAAARHDIMQAVYDKFHIQLQQEPFEI